MQEEVKKIYKNPSNEVDNCPVCGAESEEYSICPKGCFNGCCSVWSHGGKSCDGSC